MVVFEETPQYDGAVTDLLHLIYSEVKRRGGIYTMLYGGWDPIQACPLACCVICCS
jgi:hypothetical protein